MEGRRIHRWHEEVSIDGKEGGSIDGRKEDP